MRKRLIENYLRQFYTQILPKPENWEKIKKKDENKESIPCYTTIWAAGSKPISIAVTGVEKTAKGELQAKPTLQLQADNNKGGIARDASLFLLPGIGD